MHSENIENKGSDKTEIKKRLKQTIKGVAEIGVLFLLYILIFDLTGFGIPCVFRSITGLLCPGCGMTHALAATFHGNFSEAMHYNALSLTLFPILIIYLVIKLVQYVINGRDTFKPVEIVFLLVCMAVCFGYFILRNNLF
ncbi:MAG: DUF2752 domain-containing protein [Pseudobutyrivibrio sp.]|nr:DUF2752 domain-containing protein [Pseudobutyrivibrio sp.]